MKRIAMIMMFLEVFIMLFGLSSIFAGPATPERYDTGWVPWDIPLYNNCAAEQMSVTGIYRQQYVATSDGAGGYHFAMHQIIRGTAVGEVTTNGYMIHDFFSLEFNIPASGGGQQTSPINSWFHSLDKDVPDLRYHGNFIFVIDANGNLRVEFFVDKLTCD